MVRQGLGKLPTKTADGRSGGNLEAWATGWTSDRPDGDMGLGNNCAEHAHYRADASSLAAQAEPSTVGAGGWGPLQPSAAIPLNHVPEYRAPLRRAGNAEGGLCPTNRGARNDTLQG
jgi:hypothetical protein